ncbi:NAD(P)-binding protein [Whalleya microplaca]|nr:NAD(P)-binding protein [Whalleya microplaca]
MTFKIFITGVTGYIGGDALYELHARHPEYAYAVLVRDGGDSRGQEKVERIAAAYPDVRIVRGDLDDAELLREEAGRADVVLHAADASDHLPAARALARGLVEGHDAANPGYWLHTSGTGILTYFDSVEGRLGERSEREFDDWDGVGELTNLPDEAFHRNVDKVVLECGTRHADVVRTAVVCPPTIYGKGRGPVSTRSRQVYELARLILQRGGSAPIVGAGAARMNNVHVADLSAAFALLVEAAAARNADPLLWGPRGYFFVEHGEHVWGDLARAIAAKARELGFVDGVGKGEGEGVREFRLDRDEAIEIAGFEALSWGLNSRGRAERLRRVLGWKPVGKTLEEEIPEILKGERERLRLGL